jgi:hypothetical protein
VGRGFSHDIKTGKSVRLYSLRKNSVIRHSEERSDEESLFLLAKIQEGFLASLGMTDLVHFSASCLAAEVQILQLSHKF